MRRFAALAFASLVLAPAAHAAPKGPVFGLRAVGNNQRGYFVYTLAAGGSQTGAVIVSNVGNRAGTAKLFTADATTGRTTGTVYETDKQPTRAGSWVTLSSTAVTLAPGANKRVSFTVHVPVGTPVGQWVGGIVAETSHQFTKAKSSHKANVQIKIRDLTIVAVQANVPGPPIVNFKIGQVTTGGQRGFQQVIVHIASDGNMLAKANGTVTIYTSIGKIVEILPFQMDTFLPQTAIDYPVLLKKALGPGNYRATVSLTAIPTAGATKTVIAHPSFSVSKQDVKQVFTSAAPQTPPPGTSGSSGSSKPWGLIGAAAGGILVILLLLFWLVRRRRAVIAPEPVQHSPSVLAAAAADAADEPAFPEPPAAPVQAEPVVPEAPPAAPPVPAPAPPAGAARPAECTPFHFWDVAYERGQLGGDGVWRFPHRCHNCGLELLAADIADASAQADRR
jgi:hypothetical protein